jgi:hypothetical protein
MRTDRPHRNDRASGEPAKNAPQIHPHSSAVANPALRFAEMCSRARIGRDIPLAKVFCFFFAKKKSFLPFFLLSP